MHTHSLSIHPDPGRALRPWELALLLAVLEKRAGVSLFNQDVYVNVAGGLYRRNQHV